MKFKTNIKVDTVLKSGNVYPKEVMQKAIDEYMNSPEDRRCGCFYTNDDFEKLHTDVELSKVSHKIKNIEIEDGKVVVEIKILQTPRGKKTTRNV